MDPKERDANPGHTSDISWHHANWLGQTYGLEVDPWTAVAVVPHLCAVSFSSSCEEFSEPKQTSSKGVRVGQNKMMTPTLVDRRQAILLVEAESLPGRRR